MGMFREGKSIWLCHRQLLGQVRGGLGIHTGLGHVEVLGDTMSSSENKSLGGVMERKPVCVLSRENERWKSGKDTTPGKGFLRQWRREIEYSWKDLERISKGGR